MARMSPLHSPASSLTAGQSTPAVNASTATVNGAGIDLAGKRGVVFQLNVGALVGTATVAAHLQDSSDNSTFANVNTTTWSTASVAASNTANSSRDLHYSHGGQRYVRAVMVRANNTALSGISHLVY